MADCIGVKFDNGPKLHYVQAPPEVPERGDRCVVSTRRGLEIGVVRTDVRQHQRPAGHVVRSALPGDLERQRELAERAESLKWLLRARARQGGAKLKLISLEFTLDESLLTVSYTADKKAPLRLLTQELIDHTPARIDFQNVGPRDQARILGALGACGTATCSSTWLQSFNAVSIRMARDQQLPLNPEKISGPCGRLMCCLQYEHDMYKELLRGMPKKGGRACHEESGSCGRVIKLNPLAQSVDIRTDEGPVETFPADEVVRVRR
jgi:cell fate regulator YaaT (PSP1 superfamily)